jgi:hypothetical protein
MDTDVEQENLYRIQLLQAFDLEEWNDENFNTTLQQLYKRLENSDALLQILAKAKNNANFINLLAKFDIDIADSANSSNEIYFTVLFNFTCFDLFHRCLVDYMRDGVIQPNHLNKLLEAL